MRYKAKNITIPFGYVFFDTLFQNTSEKNQRRMDAESHITLYGIDDSEENSPSEGIKAGFPSPAEQYKGETIDLNKELVKHREATFYTKINGDSMKEAGISDGDIAIVDCSIEPRDGDIVVAVIDGEYTLKHFRRDESNKCVWLVPANPDFKPIKVTEENNFNVWGVVTYTIKKMR